MIYIQKVGVCLNSSSRLLVDVNADDTDTDTGAGAGAALLRLKQQQILSKRHLTPLEQRLKKCLIESIHVVVFFTALGLLLVPTIKPHVIIALAGSGDDGVAPIVPIKQTAFMTPYIFLSLVDNICNHSF